jgi:hypothetical protein
MGNSEKNYSFNIGDTIFLIDVSELNYMSVSTAELRQPLKLINHEAARFFIENFFYIENFFIESFFIENFF